MNEDRRAEPGLDRLPVELVDQLTKPFAWFLRIEALGGGILLLFTVAALALSNSPWAHSFSSAWELPVGIRIGSFEFAHESPMRPREIGHESGTSSRAPSSSLQSMERFSRWSASFRRLSPVCADP